MTYLPAMGTIDASHINSTKFPGICKPTDWPTLGVFQDLQGQLNRIAYAKKLPLIAIDGDIGPATLKLARSTGPWMMVDTSSCVGVASNADTMADSARKQADSLGAPPIGDSRVKGPRPFTPPSIVDPTTNAVVATAPTSGIAASASDLFRNMGTTTMLLLGAAVIGAGYFLTRPTKSSSAPAKQRTRYRTRTRTRYIRRYRPRSRR